MHPESSRRQKISARDRHSTKLSLDQTLVQKGLAESREKARAMIMAGLVEVEGVRVEKAGTRIPGSAVIEVKKRGLPYVSRGGLKLEEALRNFSINVRGLVLLDVGASSGGFTDCLLQHGAKRVISVDVGYGQFDWKLRNDPRVTLLERTNIRHLKPGDLEGPIHGAVIDVSFISLRLVVPPVSDLLTAHSFIIPLVKPQFEVEKGRTGKGGVVREPTLHREVMQGLSLFFEGAGWAVEGHTPSPLLGPKGNKEFLIYLTR
jgi:23S rRNA (cytidine1920-2'-O)/16S rRNA (cytidine1409-2'-O)-methyltransferase